MLENLENVLEQRIPRRELFRLTGAGAVALLIASQLPKKVDAAPGDIWDSDQWGPYFPKRSRATGQPLYIAEDDPEGIISAVDEITGGDALGQIRKLSVDMKEKALIEGNASYAGHCWGLACAIDLEQTPRGSARFSYEVKTLLLALKHNVDVMIPAHYPEFELNREKILVVELADSEQEEAGVWNVPVWKDGNTTLRTAFAVSPTPRPFSLRGIKNAYLPLHLPYEDPRWDDVKEDISKRTRGLLVPDFHGNEWAIDEIVYNQ